MHKYLCMHITLTGLHIEYKILKILEYCIKIIAGEFGVVYKGHLLKDLGQTMIGVVAIKTLKGLLL